MTYLILGLSMSQESSGKQRRKKKPQNQSYFQAKDRTKPLLRFVDVG